MASYTFLLVLRFASCFELVQLPRFLLGGTSLSVLSWYRGSVHTWQNLGYLPYVSQPLQHCPHHRQIALAASGLNSACLVSAASLLDVELVYSLGQFQTSKAIWYATDQFAMGSKYALPAHLSLSSSSTYFPSSGYGLPSSSSLSWPWAAESESEPEALDLIVP